MNGYLLDACALLALLNDEPGADKVDILLADQSSKVFMSVINVLEVAYDAVRTNRQESAAAWILELVRSSGIEILWSLTESEILAAASWKARGRLSLADAIAVASTRKLKLVTADHHELDRFVSSGMIDVAWVR